ncbi:MAG: hypothetical protein ACR2GA_03715 [Chloroflexota bacterium]
MDALARIRLRIVPGEQVHPHEIADATREARITERLRHDQILRDPLMVGEVPDVEGYVLLDGTNRRRSLLDLGLPWVLVQVIEYANEHDVALRTWCHSAPIPARDLAEQAEQVPGISSSRLDPLDAADALETAGTLAVVLDQRHQYVLSRDRDVSTRAAQLRGLVDLYEHNMTRVDCVPQDVAEQVQMPSAGGKPTTLIAFPGFSRSQVLTMAMRGALIPAGITRHIILCGRVLRVNLPLELLGESQDLDEANHALHLHLKTLQPRLYREPTILFDS